MNHYYIRLGEMFVEGKKKQIEREREREREREQF
jgi:hypothetical protein